MKVQRSRIRKRGNTRIANRRRPARNRRKLNLFRPLLALACLAGIGYGICWALHTPRLRITKTLVDGLQIISPSAIWQDALPAHGQNIITVDVGTVRRRILKHPEVADVRVRRRFPNTLIVSVTERKPAAVADCGGKLFLMDSLGRPFRRVACPLRSLPVIELPADTTPVLGRPLRTAPVLSALACLNESKKNLCQVNKISVDHHGNLCLNIGSSFFVKLGQPVHIFRKLSILRSTLEAKPRIAAKVLYFDISCPEAPVWKPKDEAGEAKAVREPHISANAVLH